MVALKQRKILVQVTSRRNQNLRDSNNDQINPVSLILESRSSEHRPKKNVDLLVDDIDWKNAKAVMVDNRARRPIPGFLDLLSIDAALMFSKTCERCTWSFWGKLLPSGLPSLPCSAPSISPPFKESIQSRNTSPSTSRPYNVNWPPKKTSMSHICPKTFTRFSSSQRMNL